MDLLWDLEMNERQRDPNTQQLFPILLSLGPPLTDIVILESQDSW
jgi:hypothetical protein